MTVVVSMYVFFVCKQKTAYEMRISDWSADVCSSDLVPGIGRGPGFPRQGSGGRGGDLLRDRVRCPRLGRLSRAFHRRDRDRLWRDRKRVVSGKSVSVRVDLGGRRIIKKIRIFLAVGFILQLQHTIRSYTTTTT